MLLGAVILPLDINNTGKYTEASEIGSNIYTAFRKIKRLTVIVNVQRASFLMIRLWIILQRDSFFLSLF